MSYCLIIIKNLQKDLNNIELNNEYKTFSNKLNSIIKKSNFEWYKNEINDNSNSKNLYSIINNITKIKSIKKITVPFFLGRGVYQMGLINGLLILEKFCYIKETILNSFLSDKFNCDDELKKEILSSK